MSRYIYITDDCLMDIAYEHMDDYALIGLQNALEEIPTADVVEVVHGEWKSGDCICPVCGEDKFKGLDADIWSDWKPNYCPNCGARMDGGER